MARHNLGKKIDANGTLNDLGNTVSDEDLSQIDTIKDRAFKEEGVYFVDGTGNTTEGTWTGTNDRITSYYDGLTINFKVGVAGADTTTLNINSLGAKTCYMRGTTKLTTHYAVGTMVILSYNATTDAFYSSDYDANSYAYVRQYGNVTTNSEFPMLFSKSATVPSTYTANYASSQAGFTYNPSTKTLTAPTIKGTTIYENGTALSSKYLGINATATNANKLGEQNPSFYLDYNNLNNKPSIPTVNNGTLTIQKNGATVGTFTANQSGNSTINIDVPTPEIPFSGFTTISGTAYMDALEVGAYVCYSETGKTVLYVRSGGTGGNTESLPNGTIVIVRDHSSSSSYKRTVMIISGTKILTWTFNDSSVTWDTVMNINTSNGGAILYSSDKEVATKDELLGKIYPVGSIYMSVNATSPASFLGGTWERIQDRFLLGAGSSYSAGSTGGEATHTLTESEMPSHRHDMYYGTEFWVDISGLGGQGFGHSPVWEKQESNPKNVTSHAGGSQPHNNMPPYLAVYIFKRIA